MSAGRRTFFLVGLATRPRPTGPWDSSGWPPNPLLGWTRLNSHDAPLFSANNADQDAHETPERAEERNPASLFEEDSEEYHLSLPSRTARSLIPPWPTLFKPSEPPDATMADKERGTAAGSSRGIGSLEGDTAPIKRSRRPSGTRHTRDLIKYIRYQQDVPTATLILSDLREIGVHIKPSRLYLHAAVLLMRDYQRNPGMDVVELKRGVLDWLSLAPKVNGSLFSPVYAKHAERFTSTLIQTFPSPSVHEINFLEDVLRTAAQHQSLPVFINSILRHLIIVAGPRKSHDLLNELVGIWLGDVVPTSVQRRDEAQQSRSDKAEVGELSPTLNTDHKPQHVSRSKLDFRTLSLLKQTNVWRNHHLRSLLQAGYTEEATSLFQAGETSAVLWEARTKGMLVKRLKKEGETSARTGLRRRSMRDSGGNPTSGNEDGEAEPETADLLLDVDDPLGAIPEVRDLLRDHLISPARAAFERLSLAAKVWKLAHSVRSRDEGESSADLIPVRFLVGVMMDLDLLETGNGSGILDRLRRRFVRPSTRSPAHVPGSTLYAPNTDGERKARRLSKPSMVTERHWYLAEMVKQREMGRYLEAVAIFRDRFLWIGLPSLPDHPGDFARTLAAVSAGDLGRAGHAREKLYPSRQVITALMPCILSSMAIANPEGLTAYHAALTASSLLLPHYMRPDSQTHLTFIRFCGRNFQSEQTEAFAHHLAQNGNDIGVHGWVAVATSWVKEGEVDRALIVLDRLGEEAGDPGSYAARSSDLIPRSFIVPALAALQRKDKKGAAMILDKLRRRWPHVRVPAVQAERDEDDEGEHEEEAEKVRATG